jgi:hypothetical protein
MKRVPEPLSIREYQLIATFEKLHIDTPSGSNGSENGDSKQKPKKTGKKVTSNEAPRLL